MYAADLAMISGDFLDGTIPKDKWYLLKYCDSEFKYLYVRYFLAFREQNPRLFCERTGVLRKAYDAWHRCFAKLEKAYQQAKESGDFELLTQIHSGEYDV